MPNRETFSWKHAACTLLARPIRSARQGALLIGIMTLGTRTLGALRELVIAYFFGTAAMVDAYRIGETLQSIFSGVARQGFDLAAVPLLVSRRVQQGEEAEHRLRVTLTTLAAILSLGIGILVLISAPVLVRLLAPGLEPASGRLAGSVLRLMVPAIIAVGLSSALGAAYNARYRFAIPRLFDPVVNITAITCLLLFPGLGVTGLAAGWSIGHLFALAVLLLPLALAGRALFSRPAAADSRSFLRLAAPGLLLSLIQPLNIAVGRSIASSLPAGSVAVLGYADRLFMLPCYLMTASLTPVLLTRFSEFSAAGNLRKMQQQTSRLLGISAALLIPAGVCLAFLARPLVNLVYLRGAFSSSAAEHTARTLAGLSVGLYPAVAAAILGVAFRGSQDIRTPVIALISGALVNAGLALQLCKRLGTPGVGLAMSAGQAVSALILYLRFYRRRTG